MIGKRDKFNDHEVNQTEQTAHDKYANELNKSSVSKNNKLLCIVTVNYVHIFDTEIKLFVFYF